MKSEYRLGRVFGIPIKIHISMPLLLLYMAFRAYAGSRSMQEALGDVVYVLIVGILLFTSIALHELGHSLVAMRKGCRVYEITLMFMGGAAKMDRMPSKPFDEFLMAIAGPAVSLLLGATGLAGGFTLLDTKSAIIHYIASIMITIGLINAILAVFNLIPAFPMDGGRVLRALLTQRLGRLQATYIASRTGRVIAVLFFFVGIFGIKNFTVYGIHPFTPGNIVLIIIAFFVYFNADREYRMVQYEELIKQRGNGPGAARPWSFTPPPDEDDDSVIISPPPYADGRASRSKLQQEKKSRRNPWNIFFGD
jgi:Zn-dependent protease